MLPQELCLDANIFLAALNAKENEHSTSLDLLKLIESEGITLFEPALVVFEVVSVLHRKVMLEEMEVEDFEKLADTFLQLPLLLQWQPVILKLAAQMAKNLSLQNTYDCTYLAVASLRQIPLITFDEELIRKGKKNYKKILSAHEFMHENETHST